MGDPGESEERRSDVSPSVNYARIVELIEPTGMVCRGGFETTTADALTDSVSGRPIVSIVMIGNVGGAMWSHFEASRPDGDDPLDAWTRATLSPIARELGAMFVHPSDEPFQPFQRWARRADAVWSSPIGIDIHSQHGLWHAYRGALLFTEPVGGVPTIEPIEPPCLTCSGAPCLTTCPVDAFAFDGTAGTYDTDACRGHLHSGSSPDCLSGGCAARVACPVNPSLRYGPVQMRLHMRAFAGLA